MLEAHCKKCGEVFVPADEKDLIHLFCEDGTECGGEGYITGEWKINTSKLKPGFFPHHTEDCDIQFRHQIIRSSGATRAYWCGTHNQWCHERPVATIFEWADGTKSRVPEGG